MKKMKVCMIVAAAMVFMTAAGYAQTTSMGMLLNSYAFTVNDMLQYSQRDYSFGTARSVAMGGAFTSLGGDIATIGINPAGLGMYRSAAFSFSPSLTTTGTFNNSSNNTNRTRFALPNIGTVFNVYENSSGLLSFNIGLSYNKVADFNYRANVTLPRGSSSINDIFAMQLNGLFREWNGIEKDLLDRGPFGNYDIFLDEWGGVLAYQAGAVSPLSNDAANTQYRVGGIAAGTDIIPFLDYSSLGSIGEYNISGGMNVNNWLYLGLGITIQNIYNSKEIYYSESYENASGDPMTTLSEMSYVQYITADGNGVNFKVGAIVRPIPSLRVGIAVHTPTYTTLTHTYSARMNTNFLNSRGNRSTSYVNEYTYNFTTPTRLMAGVSYTLGNYAIISADYERIYYTGMTFNTGESWERRIYNDEIKEIYRNTNNFRLGLEVKPISELAIRGGYSFYDSPFAWNNVVTTRILPTTTHSFSAGVGIHLNRSTTLDFAYVFSRINYVETELFYLEGRGKVIDANGNERYIDFRTDPNPNDPLEDYPITTTENINRLRQNRHAFTATLNLLF